MVAQIHTQDRVHQDRLNFDKEIENVEWAFSEIAWKRLGPRNRWCPSTAASVPSTNGQQSSADKKYDDFGT